MRYRWFCIVNATFVHTMYKSGIRDK